MPDIIINHADEDLQLAEQVQRLLEKQGWSVIYNRQLPVGRRLDEYLEVALDTARCVVTLWTSKSVAEPRVRDVANEALRSAIQVPLVAESVQLPLGQRSVRTIEYLGEDHQPKSELEQQIVTAVTSVMNGEYQQDELGDDPNSVNPSLSVRIARRVVESLSNSNEHLNASNSAALEHFYFGAWQVDAGSNALICGETTRKVQPKAMEVLMYLVSRAPQTVSIEELLDHVWAGRVVVDSAVHRCVRELRVALDDDVKSPRYIETIAKRGYKACAQVTLR